MPLSPLQKALLSSLCISGAVFTVSTAPLAMYRSQSLQVQVQNESVFAAELDALAGPYIGIASAISLLIGAGVLGISGWRTAAKESEVEQARAAELERNLLASKAELERVKFSEARLKAQGLEGFLETDAAVMPPSSLASTHTSATSVLPEPLASQKPPFLAAQDVIETADSVPPTPSARRQSQPLAAPAPTPVCEPVCLTAVADQQRQFRPSPDRDAIKTATQNVLDLAVGRSRATTNRSGASQSPVTPHRQYSSISAVSGLSVVSDRSVVSDSRSRGSLTPIHRRADKRVLPMPTPATTPSRENQLDLLLHNLNDLTKQVEDLQASRTTQDEYFRQSV